jgi:hypothetical protein
VRHVTSRVQESFRLTPPARVSLVTAAKRRAALLCLQKPRGGIADQQETSTGPPKDGTSGPDPTQPQPPPVGWVGRIGKAQLRPTRRESCERAARRLSPAGGAASRSRSDTAVVVVAWPVCHPVKRRIVWLFRCGTTPAVSQWPAGRKGAMIFLGLPPGSSGRSSAPTVCNFGESYVLVVSVLYNNLVMCRLVV